jgi:hypothetical protein
MKTLRRKVMQFNGSRYALIPFFVAENYEIEPGSSIEFDTSDPEVLVLRIRGEEGQK